MADKRDVTELAAQSLIKQVHEVRPDLDVRGGFRATKGWSPTLVALFAALLALPIVVVGLLSGTWLLFVVAAVVMAVAMVVLFSRVNSVRVVAETRDELVVFTKRKGELEEVGRRPRALTREHYWDSQWMKVKLGDETLWVARRTFEPTVDRLDGLPPEGSRP